MTNQSETAAIFEARELAEKLHQLLRDDNMHRLRLYHEYSLDSDDLT